MQKGMMGYLAYVAMSPKLHLWPMTKLLESAPMAYTSQYRARLAEKLQWGAGSAVPSIR